MAQGPTRGYLAEMVSSPYDDRHWIQPLPDSTLLLVTTKPGVASKKEQFLISRLNHTLQPVWQKRFEQSPFSQLNHVQAEGPYLYLLFSFPGTQSVLLFQVAVADGAALITHHELPEENLTITGMAVTQGQVLLSAQQQKSVLLLGLNPAERKAKLLPAIYGPTEILTDFRTDAYSKAAELVVTEPGGSQSKLQVKQFAPHGDLLGTHFVRSQNSLLEARLSPGVLTDKVIFGTFGFRDARYSQGLFTSNLAGDLQFYPLAKLDEFFSHDNSRKLKRLQRKYERHERKGKTYKLRYQVLLHPILPHPSGYVMVGEVYEVMYSKSPFPQTKNTYYRDHTAVTDGSFFQGTSSLFLGKNQPVTLLGDTRIYTNYRYKAALALVFDPKGKLLWDNSLSLNHQKAAITPTVTAAVAPNGDIVLAYQRDGELHYETMSQAPPAGKSLVGEFPVLASKDKIGPSRNPEGVIRWYGNHLIAYGYRRSGSDRRAKTMLYLQSISF
ncbi:MAG: hypothetical protein ACO1OQ_05180 [Rufibacter sp.]